MGSTTELRMWKSTPDCAIRQSQIHKSSGHQHWDKRLRGRGAVARVRGVANLTLLGTSFPARIIREAADSVSLPILIPNVASIPNTPAHCHQPLEYPVSVLVIRLQCIVAQLRSSHDGGQLDLQRF
jgi:hypothetical protein